MGHASVLHGPLPGFCSVTTDREGRAYVYICQDEEVHWVHILEVCFDRFFRIRLSHFISQHADGPAVLSFFGRSFQSIQVFYLYSCLYELPDRVDPAEHCAKLEY